MARAAVALCCAAAAAFATKPLAADPLAAAAPPDDAITQLPPLTVTAWHFGELELAIPADVVRLDRSVIENSAARSVPDLLSSEANIRFTSTTGRGNDGQIALRGFGENSGLRVLVLVDGQKINRPDMGGIEWSLVPLADIDSIEVIRGGQNVLYGNHALAGVIHIHTLRGGPARAHLQGTLGSDGLRALSTHVAGGRGAWFGALHANAEQEDGYRLHADGDSRSIGLSTGRFFQSRSGSITIKGSYAEGNSSYPGPLTFEQFLANPRQSFSGGAEQSAYRGTLLTASWESEIPSGHASVNAGWQSRQLDWDMAGRFVRNSQQAITLAPRWRWDHHWGKLISGIDAVRDALDFTNFVDPERSITRAWADLSRITLGTYALADFRIHKQLSLVAGLRYEVARTENLYVHFKENQLRPTILTNRGEFPNPNYRNPPEPDPLLSYDGTINKSGYAAALALNWQPSPRMSLWSGINRIYRYPVLDETAAYQGYPLAQPLNTSLDPETGFAVDAGYKLRSASWTLSASAFLMHLNGEIAFDDAAKLNINMGNTARIGGDLLLQFDHGPWSLANRFSAVRPRFRDGPNAHAAVPLVPAFHGSQSLSWRASLPRSLSFECALIHRHASSAYQGNDYSNTQRRIPAHSSWDARLALRGNSWLIQLHLLNFTNSHFISTAFSGGFYPANGRQIRLAAHLHF